jgi:hypothetical protein
MSKGEQMDTVKMKGMNGLVANAKPKREGIIH